MDFEVLGQKIGRDRLFLIGGPCVIESGEMACEVAWHLKDVCARLKMPFVFKSSYDKANRTSANSYRGPGLVKGLEILAGIREKFAVPVLTDVHTPAEVEPVSRVVDIIQIPAFLARQTDLVMAAGRTGKPVNLKKAQFLSPGDMAHVIDKIRQTGNERVLLTERGAQFGYNNLVVDMRSIGIMADFGYPVVFDATHSVQLPGAQGTSSGGQRRFVPALARAAVAAGAHGIFIETHPDPDRALCDGPNSIGLDEATALVESLVRIFDAVNRVNG
ncbi:MAG TPA: 3-deoxy-8-phosphooctulonate synthase [Syntrophobacteraceae bacterium]|nr:3-deoxy-8-phosphooctulonate synthase [Syntrophobacteraceae bacterium]